MGVLFTLTQDIREVTQQALDDLITELGVTCRLIYPPKPVACSALGAVSPEGVNIPPGEICPCGLCDGSGFRMVETTEDIVMGISRDPKTFWKKIPIDVPSGTIQTKCYAEDVVKIRQAREMIVQPDVDLLTRARYEIASEPEDISSIIQNRYWVTTWNRIQ